MAHLLTVCIKAGETSRIVRIMSSPAKAPEELEPASVRSSVRRFTLSNMNISETSRPIEIKFNLEHHWVGGKAA